MNKLLIANRGEIAIRIMHAAAELGIESLAVYSDDDADALHPRKADQSVALGAKGVAAYLDGDRILAIAAETGCDAVHPGYGFLSENAAFAAKCAEARVTFVGPAPESLQLFGDKTAARALAKKCGVPLVPGTDGATNLEEARAFFAENGAMMIKAVSGGGGRGMRVVQDVADLDDAFERCGSEALQAFGDGDVYVERFLPRVRHIEVQVVGDGTGAVSHLWERECSIQRRNQKIVEIAPSPTLDPGLRDKLIAEALKMAGETKYLGLGTFEFLVDAEGAGPDLTFTFIEANPRLQVEHTVTEQVTSCDLVKMQLRLAQGATLADLGLDGPTSPPQGFALQLRINMETMAADGSVRPAGGTLGAFEIPFGPGIRVDTSGFVGYRTNPSFDSLLAKLIGHSRSADFRDAVTRTYRALCEFKIEGLSTNISFLQNLMQHPAFLDNQIDTGFVDRSAAELAGGASDDHRKLYIDNTTPARRNAGAKVDAVDPLAVLGYAKEDAGADTDVAPSGSTIQGPDGTQPLIAPMQGTIVSVAVAEGDAVHPGQQVLVMEAMKMEHVITAEIGGFVRALAVDAADTVYDGDPLLFVEAADVDIADAEVEEDVDLDYIRPDLAENVERHRVTLDEARSAAVDRRHNRGHRTARENIDDLIDEGSFVEYGALTVAARRGRNTIEELIARTPADGMVSGLAQINGDIIAPEKARCAVISYDYMVLAGTQGTKNHEKKDRMFNLIQRRELPLVFFCEGGGGRPGDVDTIAAGSLHITTFHQFAELSGSVPMVGITSGYCFAGNAVLLGCCDVIIATEGSNIGMGGPAMIEGGGLGVFRPEEVGPMSDQVPNGVVDIAVEDEAEAVAVAKKYLSYFQGPVEKWECADQRWLRRAVPENRLRSYDVRDVIDTLADTDSVLEIRKSFGAGMITSFIRVEGKPLAVVANNPLHLGGAIDSPAADKAARFMQLCNAFDIPILFLCDTPGNMVGPEIEKTALVRHCCRLFVVGANLSVPFFTVVLRKAYGLGAQGMAAGGFHNPLFSVAWPTGEFGPMGLEGSVKLGFRDQLEAIEDPDERKTEFDRMVAEAYDTGKALSAASLFEIDDVIDPAETRRWIASAMDTPFPSDRPAGKRSPWIDTW
jgi:acetyl/propionyl-CoA carboxylase alpha subunit/acetyl-CoA carboxylase carboxyltransferase component